MNSDPGACRPGTGPGRGARKIRVLIVDDSLTIRRLLRHCLSSDPRLEVVAEAADPIEARALIKAMNPDVLTLDVEMPTMNGIDFLERLMRLRPMPVVMISTETHRGSAAAIEALALGAVDCIGKPTPESLPGMTAHIGEVIVQAAQAHVRPPSLRSAPPGAAPYDWAGQIVLIGASTGGVDALETVLASYPANCPPTLITQHMPAAFLASFAERLAARVKPRLSLAVDGAPVEQGRVYLAPGGETHLTLRTAGGLQCRLTGGEKRSGHRPSVDVMFASALPVARRSVAVLLTGMGRDGADEMAALRRAGATGIAQDAATSVVFGMPRAAIEAGGADHTVPLDRIGPLILDVTGRSRARPAAGAVAS
jgi:two-component system chemotaxis response regulator CheB